MLFTLPFRGGNRQTSIYFCSCFAFLFTTLGPLHVFVITSLHKKTPTPSLISRIHQAMEWRSVGLVITTSYLLVLIYQAQSYKHLVENNGGALPQPGMTLLSQRHRLSEIVMGVIRATLHLKQYIWTGGRPLTGRIMVNC